ncbi:unnamed protein product [Cercopithifilaria johnstoni]|uniref:Uncharacterized protein n=1 Tax=Cercopithifilaria johnstoni TaxID=2874296 RepID=A0A8J2LTT5_9BILA|nr:unnamed protein product [Cercopithifilaria johnstoni]
MEFVEQKIIVYLLQIISESSNISVTTLTALRKAASLHQSVTPLRPLPIKSNSSSNAFCVALPATITKKALKRTAKRMDEAGRKARILENAITNIAQQNRNRSIFHSVEQLAQSG